MNQILVSVAKAVLITIISSIATIAVERLRQSNSYQQGSSYDDDYDRWQ